MPPPLADSTAAAASPGLRLALPAVSAAVSRRWSVALKLGLIAGLIAVLHVPLLFVWDTLKESDPKGSCFVVCSEVAVCRGLDFTVISS